MDDCFKIYGQSSYFQIIVGRDVAYVTSSGTIIAAAGYSSNNVNVVIWDTIAPPSTSRASIICHDGLSLPFIFSLYMLGQ